MRPGPGGREPPRKINLRGYYARINHSRQNSISLRLLTSSGDIGGCWPALETAPMQRSHWVGAGHPSRQAMVIAGHNGGSTGDRWDAGQPRNQVVVMGGCWSAMKTLAAGAAGHPSKNKLWSLLVTNGGSTGDRWGLVSQAH